MPLALFTVEALTNAYKHAYPIGQGGRICVNLAPFDGAKLRLSVEDDGIGFQYDDVNASVGARLIKTFGQQVSGEASISSEKGSGTIVEIVFPDPDLKKPCGIKRAGVAPTLFVILQRIKQIDGLYRRAAASHHAGDQADREQNQEDNEDDLRDFSGRKRDPAEAEDARDNRNDEERQSPSEHGTLHIFQGAELTRSPFKTQSSV